MNAKKLYKTDVVLLVSFLNTHMFKGTVLMSPNVGICNSSCFFVCLFFHTIHVFIYIYSYKVYLLLYVNCFRSWASLGCQAEMRTIAPALQQAEAQLTELRRILSRYA
jgi:hypothetical protein